MKYYNETNNIQNIKLPESLNNYNETNNIQDIKLPVIKQLKWNKQHSDIELPVMKQLQWNE